MHMGNRVLPTGSSIDSWHSSCDKVYVNTKLEDPCSCKCNLDSCFVANQQSISTTSSPFGEAVDRVKQFVCLVYNEVIKCFETDSPTVYHSLAVR